MLRLRRTWVFVHLPLCAALYAFGWITSTWPGVIALAGLIALLVWWPL